jgi:HEAT repeat protein
LGRRSKYIEYHLQRQQKIPAVVAFDALAEIGVKAAPPLIESLKSDDILARVPNSTLALAEMGAKASSDEVVTLLTQALQHPDWTIRKNASLALGSIGSKAAIPALVDSAPSRWGIDPATTLGQIGFKVILNKKRVPYKDKQDSNIIPTLAAALENEDWQVRVVAVAALGLTSENAIPWLNRSFQDSDWRVRSTAISALGRLYSDKTLPSLIAASYGKDWRVRRNLTYAIDRSDRTIPVLTRLLKDSSDSVRFGAAIKLGGESDLAVPILVNALQHNKDGAERIDALRSFDYSNSEVAAIAIIKALKDKNSVIRGEAAFRLSGSLDKYSKLLRTAAISALIISLKDENAEVRRSAASALDEAGEIAVPALIKASQDKNERVRISAIKALGKIGSKSAISAIRAYLRDESEVVRTSSAEALGNSGIQSATYRLQNIDWQIRRNTAEELGVTGVNLNNSSIPTLQALVKALQDQNPNVRTSAAAALVKSGGDKGGDLTPAIADIIQKAAPGLIDSLENGDSLARLDAIFALGAIGSGARVAVPQIQNKLKDENWLVRYAAAVTLLKINPKDESVAPVLAEIFSNPDYAQMIAIDDCCTDHPELEALANIGSEHAIAALINSLQISDEKLRYTFYLESGGDRPPTAGMLIKIGPRAIPALIAALENEKVRFLAADTLGQIGVKSIPSLLEVLKRRPGAKPALSEILEDKDVDIRRSAVYALGSIGNKYSASKEFVIEVLTKVMNDENEHLDVRWMAAASMAKMGKPVERFFVDHNLPEPVKDACIESRFIDRFLDSDFDLYAGRCLYSMGGRGAGLAQIYQQVRVLLSGNLSSSSTTSKPEPNHTR